MTPAAAPPDEEDPFADLDALASLESTGRVAEPEESPAPRRRAAPPEESAEAPAPAAAHDPNFMAYGTAPVNPFVTLPGEEAIDKYLPWVPVGIFLAMLGVGIYRGIAAINDEATAAKLPNELLMQVIAKFLGFMAGVTVAMIGVLAPLCLLGVFIASKIMKFTNPHGLYLKCLAVMCTPASLAYACNGFDINREMTAVSWWVSVPAMVGVLWLLMRLRALPFAVTASFAALLSVGLPMMLFFAIVPHRPGTTPRPLAGPVNSSPRSAAPRPSPNAPQPESIFTSGPTQQQLKGEAHLREIAIALDRYTEAHDGNYPVNLEEMAYLGREVLLPSETRLIIVYLGTPRLKAPISPKIVLAYCGDAAVGKRSVLFGDGHVETIDMARWGGVFHESMVAEREARNPK